MDLDEVRVEIEDERFYRVGDQYYPSVTTILEAYPTGPGLTRFYARNGWRKAKAITQHSMEIGQKVHETIDEELLEGESIHYDDFRFEEWKYLVGFRNFMNKHNLETDKKESMIVSHAHEYAGTLDWEGEVDGDYVRIDWKTSNNVYEKHKIQLAAYEMARREANETKADELWIIQLDSGTKQKYSKRKVKDVEDKFQAFLDARAMWKRTSKGRPSIKEVPAKIQVKGL